MENLNNQQISTSILNLDVRYVQTHKKVYRKRRTPENRFNVRPISLIIIKMIIDYLNTFLVIIKVKSCVKPMEHFYKNQSNIFLGKVVQNADMINNQSSIYG